MTVRWTTQLITTITFCWQILGTQSAYAEQQHTTKIVADVCVQEMRTSVFPNLVSCSTSEVFVSSVGGWIVEENYVYGALTNGQYFFMNNHQKDPLFFRTMHMLDIQLKKFGLLPYDMNIEQNMSHVKSNANQGNK